MKRKPYEYLNNPSNPKTELKSQPTLFNFYLKKKPQAEDSLHIDEKNQVTLLINIEE